MSKFIFTLLILLLISCQQGPSLAIITNQGEDTISIVNLNNEREIKKISSQKEPLAVLINPKSNIAYIGNVKSNSISILDLNKKEIIENISLGFSPLGIAADLNFINLYITSWYENKVYKVDLINKKIKKIIEVENTPSGIVYNKIHDLFIIANRDKNSIQLINNDLVIKTIKVGIHPFGVETWGDFIYVTNVYDDTITEINLITFNERTFKVGSHPYNSKRFENMLFVTNTQDASVSVINLDTITKIKILKTSEVPENIDIDPVLKKIVVTSWAENEINIFNLNDFMHLKTIKTGKESRSFGQFIMYK